MNDATVIAAMQRARMVLSEQDYLLIASAVGVGLVKPPPPREVAAQFPKENTMTVHDQVVDILRPYLSIPDTAVALADVLAAAHLLAEEEKIGDFITCDHPGCQAAMAFPDYGLHGLRIARDCGWSVSASGDYCSTHKENR
jgi:hypothetical protein